MTGARTSGARRSGAARGAVAVVLVVLVVLAASVAVAWVALTSADGVVRIDSATSRTEFISGWWALAWLLVPVPVLFARRPRVALGLTIALVVPQFAAAAICVHRYRASGWGDGLEIFAYAEPIALTVVALLAIALRTIVRARRLQP